MRILFPASLDPSCPKSKGTFLKLFRRIGTFLKHLDGRWPGGKMRNRVR